MTLATLLLAASPALAGLGADCGKAYKPEYETLWGVTYADWEDGCRQGNDDKDLLRWLLKNSVEVCARRYQKAADAGKVHPTTIRGYCAQGPAGRSRLSAMTGIPEREEPPKPPEPPPAPPSAKLPDKDFGLGPLVSALQEAKDWQSDACLASLTYDWSTSDKYGPDHGQLHYYFYSRTRWPSALVKRAGAGPAAEKSKQTRAACVTGVDIDLPAAIERARRAGLPIASKTELSANLEAMLPEKARETPQLSRFKGKAYWNVIVGTRDDPWQRGVLLDAGSGRVFHKGPAVNAISYSSADRPR